jgi:hypothetical protein
VAGRQHPANLRHHHDERECDDALDPRPHARVLEREDWPLWLGEEGGGAARLLRPADNGILQLWPVSTRVNAPKNNGPTLLDRAIEEADGGGPNPAQTGRRSDST